MTPARCVLLFVFSTLLRSATEQTIKTRFFIDFFPWDQFQFWHPDQRGLVSRIRVEQRHHPLEVVVGQVRILQPELHEFEAEQQMAYPARPTLLGDRSHPGLVQQLSFFQFAFQHLTVRVRQGRTKPFTGH